MNTQFHFNFHSGFVVMLIMFMLNACGGEGADSSGLSADSGGASGKGGSMARFTIINEHLYALADDELQVLNISNAADPVPVSRSYVGWDVETLFAYGDMLFMGAQTGMYIYDVSQPRAPEKLSQFRHVRSCDPVVVQGKYAYVTLRGGVNCGGMQNRLDVLDVSNVMQPVLVTSYSMQAPTGLGVDGDKLFVCDGGAGLKVFDISNTPTLQLLERLSDVNCFDVIANNGVLLVSDAKGLMQFDYAGGPMQLLSEILGIGKMVGDNSNS